MTSGIQQAPKAKDKNLCDCQLHATKWDSSKDHHAKDVPVDLGPGSADETELQQDEAVNRILEGFPL